VALEVRPEQFLNTHFFAPAQAQNLANPREGIAMRIHIRCRGHSALAFVLMHEGRVVAVIWLS